jgi:hypothetical protein
MRKSKEQMAGAFFDEFSRWIATATPQELKWLSRQPMSDVRKSECLAREISLRGAYHWQKSLGFWITAVTMIFAGIAAWPTVHDWLWPSIKKDTQSQSLILPSESQTPLPSESPTPLPTSPDASSPPR